MVGRLASLQGSALRSHLVLHFHVSLDLALHSRVGLALRLAQFSLTVSVLLDCLDSLTDELRLLVLFDLGADVAVALAR